MPQAQRSRFLDILDMLFVLIIEQLFQIEALILPSEVFGIDRFYTDKNDPQSTGRG